VERLIRRVRGRLAVVAGTVFSAISGSTIATTAILGALMLPPHGLLLMTMRGVAPPSVSMAQIFIAVVPYVVMSLILLVAIFWIPPIATWLPALIG